MSQMLVNFNGRFIPHEGARLPLNDAGLLYGDTLFETFRAEKNRILLQNEHLDRISLSAQLLGFPCDRPRIETALAQMATALTAEISRLRLTLGRGTSQRFILANGADNWFALTAVATAPPNEEDRNIGAVCVSAPNHRTNPLDHLPQMKRGNHADCLYAADFASKHNAREALFLENNLVIEGSSSNIFALFGETLFTPPIDKLVLAGVTRGQIISTAIEFGLQVIEEALTMDKLLEADEIWLSNALVEILPVASIDGHAIKRGRSWHKIHTLYKHRTET
jgi:branched-chain amino acid aminotransferase